MEIQAVEKLTAKKCRPCEGGVEPCSLLDATRQLELLPGWYLTHNGQRIQKDWTVRNFIAGMDFFNQIATLAEIDGHHPDLHIEAFRNVSVVLWTHAIGGLSENDFILAAKIEQISTELRPVAK